MDPLLELLQTNARMSLEDLAAQLDMTPEQVAEKIAKYEKDNEILGYHAVLDEDKLNGEELVTAMIELKISPTRGTGFDKLAQRIARFEQVESCFLMSGAYDLLLMVKGRSLKDVALFIAHKVSTIEGVLSTATHFQLKCYKRAGFLFEETTEPRRLAVAP